MNKKKKVEKFIEVDEEELKDSILTIHIESESEEEQPKIKQKSKSKPVISLSEKKIRSKKEPNKNEALLGKKRERENIKQKKSKSEVKTSKVKIKKGVDFKKGKYNIRVELVERNDDLEGKESIVNNSCCVVCSNRNCVRAAKTKNYNLMSNCINDRKHISTLVNPYSVGIGNAIEIAIENNDRKMIEMIFNSRNEDKDPKMLIKPRCYIEKPKIKLVDTGVNSEFMIGVKTRKLNQTRGNKMGNDAFIRDDIETNENDVVNQLCEEITEKCDDPSLIDFMKSLQFKNSNNSDINLNNGFGNNYMNMGNFNNQRYYNNSNDFNFSFESFIINAVLKGNIKIAKYLLKDLDKNYNYGFNALHYDVLAKKKAEELTIKVKTSLTKKPQTNDGMTPMHVVCINPDDSFIKRMVELGGDWNILDDLHRKPIHYAACCKGNGPLNYLISLGALIDEVDKEKKSPLMYACISGRLDCVKSLIKKNANILLKDQLLKNTAFHYACKYGYKDIVEYFLENTTIKVDLPGEDRMTGLMLASLYGHFELVEFLVEHKAKVTKKDKFKRTPLLHAVRGGQLKIVSYLLTKGAEYELPDNSNNTPLHYACASGFKNIAKLLLKAGASPNPSNDWKYTPLEISFLKNHFGIVKFLLDYVDVNTKFNLDMCLIHYSFKNITQKVVEDEIKYLIIEKNCDINIQDYYGKSIMHYLAEFTLDKFCQDNYQYLQYISRDKAQKKQEKYKELLLNIFDILNQRKELDINLVDKQGKSAFQIAIEINNFYFIEEIMKKEELNLFNKDGNSILHSLIPLVFENKISIEKKSKVINQIIDKLKISISEEELSKISNSFDGNGFTPLLKLMQTYHQNINIIFENIKREETTEYKKTLKTDSMMDGNDTMNFNNFGFNNNIFNNTGLGFSNNNLTQEQLNEIHERSLTKLNEFIKFLKSIIKMLISLKVDPMIVVKKDTGKSENSILLYLMKYPSKILLEYFIKELKIPVNTCNLYNRNSLYFLFDNLNQIKYITNNDSLSMDSLNYLIKEGINIEQIDKLGNNPFLYLSMINFNEFILKILLKNKCDINIFNKNDNNCLFFYVRKKDLNIVKKLIEDFKVDYTICDSKKRSIIHYLCNDEVSSTDMDERLCDYLLSKNIKLNQPDIYGRIPIHYLFVKIGNEYANSDIDPVTTLTKFLEYEEVDREYKDIYGNTPLHYACQRGSIISIISLGGKKIDYDVKNKENNSPLAYSILFKKENVAINLIQQKVDLDQYVYPLQDRKEKNKSEELKTDKNNDIGHANINNNFIGNNSFGFDFGFGENNNLFNNSNFANTNIFNNPFSPNKNNIFKNNFNNYNNNNKAKFESTNLFSIDIKGEKLFRLCIRNNFQGLTHLFITRGYGLVKAVEDCFCEQKFNLAMKLLTRFPYNKTYQGLNREGQNLFHIIGNINNNALSQFFSVLYSKEIPLNLKDNYGNTPLHYAAKHLFTEFISFIVKKFEDKNLILDIKNNDNDTPFNLATKGNNINIINKNIFDLLFTNNQINELYEENENIINKLNDSNNNNTYKCSLLIVIVRIILVKTLTNGISFEKSYFKYFYNKLIENGASVTVKDSYGKTCLHYAVLENNLYFLKQLCENVKDEIDKNIIDNDGKSLVHYCVSLNNFGSYENADMLNYLLDNKFLSTSKDNLNKTPLDYALEQKTLNNLKILINKEVPGTEKININDITIRNQDNLDNEKANTIPYTDFEKDSEEYYNKQLKLVPPSKRIKRPNLFDYQTEFFELYSENDEYWDASLTKVNLQNGIYGEYMFYFIQLIHDLGQDMYIVTTQFGRIGEEGANQRSPFNSIDEAKKEFSKIFKSKTGNLWEERERFDRKKGKYMLLKYNKIKLKPSELLKPFEYEKCPKSKIKDRNILNLLKNITDSSVIEKAFKESGLDTQFFNYSMLNKETLMKARGYLMEIYHKVQELEYIRKIPVNINNEDKKEDENSENDNNDIIEEKMGIEDEKDSKDNDQIVTEKDKIDKLISKTNEIMELSSRYYELIPKEKYRNRCILPLVNLNEVRAEIQIIDNLTYVEKAVNILLGAYNKIEIMNPLDYIYNSLQTYFENISNESPEFATLKKYINASSETDKIINIFRVSRKGESEQINAFKDFPNHYLLFHGTKIFNLIGIFANGLKIAPPEAPVTGYLFGKGIYLSDMYQKSIAYCDTFVDKSNPQVKRKISYILLCEAALGEIYEANKSNLDIENLPFLKNGYNSLKSISSSGPDLNKKFICNNGIIIPLGSIVSYNKNINNFMYTTTTYPEYVIYDTSQVKIRYIVQVEKNAFNY